MFRKRVLACLMLGLVLAIPLAAAGCSVVTGSGELATWDMVYTDFDEIEVGSAFEVEVSRADAFLVRITIDKKLYEYLDIDQRGHTLRIRLKPNHIYTDTTQRAIVTLPDLQRLELSGASEADVSGFSVTHTLDFELSGASRMELGHTIAGDSKFSLSGASKVNGYIETDNGRFEVSGASQLTLKGNADNIDIEASGASDVTLPEFAVLTADVNLSGASDAVINVADSMDVHLSGGSELEYIGTPRLGELDVSGGSTLDRRE